MNDVQAKQQRDVQAGLLHCDALVFIHLAGGRNIEQSSDLAFADHVIIIGAAGARPCRLSCRILNELAYFFLEGHLLQQFFNFLFRGRIAQTRTNCGGSGDCRGKLALRRDRLTIQHRASDNRRTNQQVSHGLDAPVYLAERKTNTVESITSTSDSKILNRFTWHFKELKYAPPSTQEHHGACPYSAHYARLAGKSPYAACEIHPGS